MRDVPSLMPMQKRVRNQPLNTALVSLDSIKLPIPDQGTVCAKWGWEWGGPE